MYKIKENINETEYNEFIKQQSTLSFMQTLGWGRVKESKVWQLNYYGIYDEEKIVGVFYTLKRLLPLGKSFMYIPRGFVLDYTNNNLLSFITLKVKEIAKKNKAIFVKIDPNFCLREYYKNNDNSLPNYSKITSQVINNLKQNNYRYQGVFKHLGANFQPQYNMVVPLIKNDNSLLSQEAYLKTLKPKIRYFLKPGFYEEKGLKFVFSQSQEYLDEFVRLTNQTASRQHINLRNKEYFSKILKNTPSYLVMGVLNLEKYKEYLLLKKEDTSEVMNLLKDKKELIITAALIVMPTNDKGIRMSEYLYAGNDLIFPKLSSSLGLVYEIIKFSIEEKCHYCNLGGIDGNLDDKLSTFKNKFNPLIFEYIGEYDLVIKKYQYFIFKKILPKVKKIIKKIHS